MLFVNYVELLSLKDFVDAQAVRGGQLSGWWRYKLSENTLYGGMAVVL